MDRPSFVTARDSRQDDHLRSGDYFAKRCKPYAARETTAEKRKTTATMMPKARDTQRPWSNQETLTEKAFNVSGAVDDPENLNTVGERAVEDEIALEAFHRPDADGREARIPQASLGASSGICAKA